MMEQNRDDLEYVVRKLEEEWNSISTDKSRTREISTQRNHNRLKKKKHYQIKNADRFPDPTGFLALCDTPSVDIDQLGDWSSKQMVT